MLAYLVIIDHFVTDIYMEYIYNMKFQLFRINQ